MKKYIVLIMIILIGLSTFDVFGQRRNNTFISGTIIDGESDNPLSYVNITVYNIDTDKLVSGAIADKKGNFRVNNIPFGKYYLIVKLIGYEKKKFNHIVINQKKPSYDMGKIILKLSELMTDEVEVVAEKPLMEYKMDKKIINVSRDIVSQGGSAVNVLQNSPSVQVDIEGNVSLRGSSNFAVYINNKPSILDGSDALEQIPASSIETIEIITNPSAKYDPDGIGGIINVVLKKEGNDGTTGLLDISVGTKDKYSANIVLNQRISNFVFSGGINYRDNTRYAEGNSKDIFKYLNPVKYYDSELDGHRKHKSLSFSGGIEYNINKTNKLILKGRIGSFGFSRNRISNRLQWYENNPDLDTFFVNDNYMDRERQYYSLYLDHFIQLGQKGHQLVSSFEFSQDEGGGDNKQLDYIADKLWEPLNYSSYNVWSDETELADEYRIKMDYTLPFSQDSKFEAGYQARIDVETEEYTLKMMDSSSKWVVQPEFDNAMDFNRNIHSIYSTYGNKIGDFSFKVGTRGEYTLRTVGVRNENKDYTIDRFDFFPSIHLSQNISETNQVMLSYTRRIDRPRGWDLEPSIMYWDANTVRKGNPSLEPEYIDSYELGFQKYFGMSYLSFEGFYRNTKNKITRVKDIEDDKIIFSSVNLNQDHTLGLEFAANYEPSRSLRFNLSSSVFNYSLDGNVLDSSVSRSTTSWDANFFITYWLKSTNTRFQFNGFYSGPTIYAQGSIKDRYAVNFAIQQELYNRQLMLNLQVRDILRTMKREYSTDTQDLYTYDLRNYESPIVTLSITYRINNFKQKRENNNGSGGEGDMDF